jgi:CubicO group peptidase (beta-lactamase class C family)
MLRLIPGIVVILATFACNRASDAPDSTQTAVVRVPSIAPSESTLAQLAADIDARRAELRIPGAAVAIVTPDRGLMSRGFGLRDVERALPVTSATLFATGSCTKPFTSLAFAVSADSGIVSLDDSPRRFLPWFTLRDSLANAQASFRDLLSHRTGVKMDDRQGWYERHPTRERLIRFAMSGEPNKTFRSTFQYNNFLYVAAGEALAAAHGITFADVLRRTIFEPLGMDSTTTSLARVAASSDFSYGYRGGPNEATRERVAPRQMFWLDGIEAAGAVWTSADDISRWLRMLAGGGVIDGTRFVSDTALAALLTPHVRTGGARYGLGWFIENWHGDTLYSHAGGVSGFGALCEFLPSRGLGWAILTNVDDGTLPKAVRELIYQHLLRSEPLP